MASHYVAIAKASFAASCIRPDPFPVARDEINRFHSLLEAVVAQCNSDNVQKCKNWLCINVLPSSPRVTALGKYLAALSTSYGKPPIEVLARATAHNQSRNGATHLNGAQDTEKPSLRRKRLHLLYLLNDLLHHAKYHSHNRNIPGLQSNVNVASTLQPHLSTLVDTAASFDLVKHAAHHRRLQELLDIWEEHGYYSREDVSKLRETVAAVAGSTTNGSPSANQHNTSLLTPQEQQQHPTALVVPADSAKEPPYMLPPTHGDLQTPYYDLPAANLLPHIPANSNGVKAINPAHVRPVAMREGPAPSRLIEAVKDLLAAADEIYGGSTSGVVGKHNGKRGRHWGLVIDEATGRVVGSTTQSSAQDDTGGMMDLDIDAMGQRLVKDEETGEWAPVEGYYGWSVDFCKKMRQRKKEKREKEDEEDDDMSGTRSAVGMGMGMGRGLGMSANSTDKNGFGMGTSMGIGRGIGRGMGVGHMGMGQDMHMSGMAAGRGWNSGPGYRP